MFENLAKEVAKLLYKTDDPDMWEVMADADKALCRNIVSAVLTRLRRTDTQMVRAGDKELAGLIDRLEHAGDAVAERTNVLISVFQAMVAAAERRNG